MKISVRHARSGATSIVAAVVGSIIATSAMAQELEEVTVTMWAGTTEATP